VPTVMDKPIRTAPIIIISVLGCVLFSPVNSAFTVASVDDLEIGFVSWAILPTAIKIPIAKIINPSKNRRSLNMAVLDFPRKAPMFSLR